jgi:hypothetical protein
MAWPDFFKSLGAYSSGNCSGFTPDSLFIFFNYHVKNRTVIPKCKAKTFVAYFKIIK